MPIFEVNGKRYDVAEEYIEDFAKEFPNAYTTQEYNGNKLNVKVGDYQSFLNALNESPIEEPADSTSLLKDSPYAAQFAEETPEEKAKREARRAERRDIFKSYMGAPSNVSLATPNMTAAKVMPKVEEPQLTPEQVEAAENERLFKQHLEDSGHIKKLYEMRDKAREDDGSNGIWDYINPLGEKAPIGGIIHLLRSAFSEDYRDKKRAQKRNRLIAEQADKAIDVYEQATGDRNGISSVFNAIADEASRISTWDLGMTDLQNAATLYDLSQKDESELTASEKATLDAIGLASSVMDLYGDEVGAGYKMGQGIPATVSFMGSMALNPAAGYGKKLAGDAVKKFGKDYVKRVAKRVAGDILETGAYVGSVALPQVAANTLDRINGSTTYDLDDDLNVVYGGQEDQEALGNAIWKAFGETFIEGYTERVGDYFDPIIGFAKGVTKGIKAGKLSDFAEALVEVKPTATMQNIRRFKEKTLFNGTLSELMEEELGMIMNAYTVGDYTFDKEEAERTGKTYILDPENQFVTGMSVGMFSAAINGTEMAANHAYKRMVNKVAEKYGKIAERELGAQFSEMIDGVPSLKERIDNADADEKYRIFVDILGNPNLNDKQKAAVAKYAIYRQYAQTFNAVQANALNHKMDEVKEQHAAYEAGYSSALPAFYNIANAFKEAQQSVNDYTERTGDSSVMDAIRLIENNPSEIKNIKDGLTDEQYQLVTNYKNTLERYRGAYQGRSDKLEDYMDEVAFVLEPAINADANGNRTITTATYKDEPVYVTYNDGTNATIMRFNGEKLGDKTPLLTRDLSEIVSYDAEQYINDYRQQITGQMNAETENASEHHPKTQAPRKDLVLLSPEGEVVITAVNDNMVEIVPAVYKDGQVQPKDGAEPQTITVDDAYAWQDSYYQGLDDAAAATASQPTVDNMSAETAENEGTPTEQIEQSVSEEVTDGQIFETQPTEEIAESVAPAAPQTARERVPKDDKGNPIYEQADADTAWDAIVEETEGDTEMAQRVATDMLEDKKAALAKLQNGKPKKGATVAEKIANEKAHQAAIAQAQSDVAQWEAIVGTEARRREAAMSEADRYAAEMEQKSINDGLTALGEAQSIEEYVLGQLAGGAYKLRWSDKENGTKGFGSHTGLSTEEMKARLSMIDNKNGLTPEEIAHSIVENMDASFGEVDVMDVTNMVIDAVATNASRRAMLNGMVESRAELMRQQARAEQEAKDAWYMEQYHATEEELAAYREYLAEITEEIIADDANYEERFNTFAELIADEYDNQGTDADIRSSADQGEGLASDREGSSSVGEGEETDRQGAVLGDAPRFAEAEDGRAGSSVSAESDDRQSRIDRAVADYRENVDDSPEAIAAAERDQQRYEADMADDASETVETLENGDVRRTNRNSNGEIATVVIERDGNVISVDTYEDGTLFERTDYDANGNATKVTRYKDGEVISEQEYKDGKRKVTANVEDVRRTPLSELEYVKRETDRLFNEREDQSLSRKEWELTDEGVDAENAAIDSYPSYIQSLSDSGELQRMFDLASVGEEIQIRRAVEAAGLELDDVVDTSVKRANAKAARDKKRAEKAKKLIESVTTNKEKQNGSKETIPEGGPRGRRSEKQGENQGNIRQGEGVIGRQIEEFEQRTGWTRGLSDTERLILEDVRKLTDSEIGALRGEAVESIERGEDVEEAEIVLGLLDKYGRSGERLYLLSQSGIIPNQPVSLDKVEQLFMEYNEDEGLAILFDRLRPIIEQINPKITFEVIRDADGNVKDNTVGDFYLKDNHLRFNLHSLNSSYQTDQEKASTIVHEMLHAVTQYALDAKQRVNNGEEAGVELSKQLLDAAQSLINIYNAVKDNPILAEEYGIKDVHEMVSELANPEFRDKLKQIEVKGKSAWERIKDAIKRFLNRFGDIYDTSAYSKAMSALDELMDNFDIKAYERSRALGSEAKESRVDNLRFRDGDNQDAAYMDAVERGDMETAQRMVDEVLKDAGYTIRGEHGTTHKFTIFNNINANIENSFGKGFYFTSDAYDAEQNYSHDEGPDLKNRIELLAERMEFEDAYEDMDYDERIEEARKRLSGGENIVISAAIRMENPCVFSIDPDGVYKETFFDVEEEYDEENDEYGEPTGLLVDFANALNEVLAEGDYWGADRIDASKLIYDGYYSADQLKRKVDEMLMDITDEEGNLASTEIFRSALERMGFDGIIDNAPSLRFKNMGLSRDTKHYIAFSPNQIKQSDAVTYDNDGNIIPLSERANRANDDIRFREGEGVISDREVSYENDPVAKFMGKPRYYGKRASAFAERERRRMENAAKEAAEMLGIEAEIVTDASTLQGRKAKAKGWYDIVNKKVVVVVPNHVSMGDAVRTVLHEGIAHHGLRELFGDGFDAMLDNVYNNVSPELKARIDAIAERTGVSTSVATEEYMASLAETTNFEEAQRRGWWQQIKSYFVDMLRKLAMPGLKLKEEITDNELRYLLWRSYKNLVEPNSYLKPLGYAEDVVKQKELKVGEYAEKAPATPMAADTSEAEEWAAVTMQRIEELEAQAAQLENEIAEMEADRDADDASRYEMWEQQLEPLRKQMEDVYAELEGLYSLEAEDEDVEDYEAEREAEKERQLYQKRIDNAYLKAVREGDWEEATDLFRQYVLSKAEDEGIVPMDYGVGYRGGAHSSIAKKVKEENPDAIAEAAYQMSIRIPKGSILVPMPSRTGNATYTVKLAEAIAKATDSEVRDVLKGKARMSVYEAKQKGIKMTPEDLGMYTTEELPKGKNIVIIDNVIDKGTTALAAVSAVKGASVVAYAYTLGDKQRVASLKLAEPVTYDDNKRIIPLSRRFDKETDDIRYRMSINEEEFDNTQREAARNIGIVMPNLGDAEVNIVDVPRHDFTGTGKEAIRKAKEWANRELVGEHVAKEGTKEEFKYSIDEKSVKKFLSGVSTSLSDNLGVHLSVLKKLPSVIDSSIEAEIHADYKKGEQRTANNGIEDENLLIHRFYGCAKINGELYRVKTTIKERKSAGVKPYTYEVTKIELLDGSSPEGTSLSDASSNSISGAKLLKGVEKSYDKGKFLLDESKRVSENPINSEEITAEVERESAALGVPVRIARSVDELPDDAETRKRAEDGSLKGVYSTRDGEVVVYLPNTENANDAKRTILHEIVGHKVFYDLSN